MFFYNRRNFVNKYGKEIFMKNVLFSFMVSVFALTSFQAAEAGKSLPSLHDNEEKVGRRGIALKPDNMPTKKEQDPSLIQWIPQAPVSRIKNPKLHKHWSTKAKLFPHRFKMEGDTPCFAKEYIEEASTLPLSVEE